MKQRTVARLITLLFALTILSGCTGDEPSGPPPIMLSGAGDEIVYTKHIGPIFLNSCGGSDCHTNGGNEAGLRMETWEAVMEGSDYGAVIIPYSSTRSHLFQHINTDTTIGPTATPTMPLSLDPLPTEQVLAIMRWIDEGAKNDNGEIALSGETRPRVFVTAQSEDKVVAIDLVTERIMRYISVGSRPDATSAPEAPHNIVFSPDRKYFYVNMIAGGSVEKYDARTFQKLGETQVGVSPAQVVVTANGSTLYVSNFDQTEQQRFVNKVDAGTMTTTEEIDIGGLAPHGVTLSTDERFLYTMNANSNDISEVDLATLELTRRFPIVPGGAPSGAKYEPYQGVIARDGLLYVTCRASEEVRVIDLANGEVVDSIHVGKRPLIPAISPDGKELWIPNQGSNTISVIDIASRMVVATIPDVMTQPHAVAFTDNGATAYVSCENQNGGENLHHPLAGTAVVPGIVYIIDTATRTVRREVEVGGFAAGIIVGG